MSLLFLLIVGIVLWLVLVLRMYLQNSSSRPSGRRGTRAAVVNSWLGSSAGVYATQGMRGHMEDTYQAALSLDGNPRNDFYGVFDGHGGHECSEFAALRLHELLLEEDYLNSPLQALRGAFKKLDRDWLTYASQHDADDGSTAITALFLDNKLYVSNVGDSRAVLSSRGKAFPLSHDHKPNREDEKERIQGLGGRIIHYGTWRVEGVLAVTRAIGDRRLKQFISAVPDIQVRELMKDDDLLILASDGLWDVVDPQESVDTIRGMTDMQEASKKLAELAFVRGSMDNITVLVIDLAHRQEALSSL